MKQLKIERPDSYLQRLIRVLVKKQQHGVGQEDVVPLCRLCAVFWQSRVRKHLHCSSNVGLREYGT